MKQRFGFVSNSSSASFILKMRALKNFQLRAVIEHLKYAEHMLRWKKEEIYNCWKIDIRPDRGVIAGDTMMDNFDMETFFEQLGIPSSEYEYEKDG